MKKAIICDLDGTLFDCQWRRDKYLPDFDLFNQNHIYDKPNDRILEIINRFKNDYTIIFVSGRNIKYENTTRLQINKYIDNYLLFMRQNNDFRSDEIIKKEIYDNNIKNNFDVFFILDDRTKVVNMWRNLGLICLQVNNYDY